MPYKFRNLPCNILPDDQLWCVTGTVNPDTRRHTNEPPWGGVLEWCWGEEDANIRLQMMQEDPTFSNLKAVKWEITNAETR